MRRRVTAPDDPRVVEDPEELAALFARDRECHVYGLADLVEPYWSGSTWWRRGDAAVGVVPLPGSDEVAYYGVSPRDPAGTIALLAEVHEELPAGAVGSAPVGHVEALRPLRGLDDLGPRVKMVVDEAALRTASVPDGTGLVRLASTDHDEVVALHDLDPDAVFFVRSMWRGGRMLGARTDDGTLVATAGTHVLAPSVGVAAIGAVFTHPAHRGRGLAAAVTSRLAASLLDDGLTVGLNVAEANRGARRVYARLGFRTVHRYEEARLR